MRRSILKASGGSNQPHGHVAGYRLLDRIPKTVMVDDKICELLGSTPQLDPSPQRSINTLEPPLSFVGFGTTLANSRDELRNGRAEMIRATGAVLIASVLLYFWRNLISIPSRFGKPE